MDTKNKPILTITQYTDPYCTWCWGSEPVMRRIEETYPHQIRMVFVMGGLVEDVSRFFDPLNKIGGKQMMKQVAAHWEEASIRHGMPVDASVWTDPENDFVSTWPANIACKAASFQGDELGNRYIRRMREAAAAEHLFVHRFQVQEKLAAEVGLDVCRFAYDLQSGFAEMAFKQDLERCYRHAVQGFPTFVIRNQAGRELGMNGYQLFSDFERLFRELAGEKLRRKEPVASKEALVAFIGKHERVAPREVAEVFSLSPDKTDSWIKQLENEGLIRRQKAGNGFFFLKV